MRAWALPVVVLLVATPMVDADGGHGDSPTESTLYFHFTGDGLAINPTQPSGAVLAPAAGMPATCGSALTWTGVFTRGPVEDNVTWTHGLARYADIPGAVRLLWYIETVQPGTDAPMEIPLQDMRLQATLRAGDTDDDIGQGKILANGTTVATPTGIAVDGRYVYRMETFLAWTGAAGIDAADGFHVEVALDAGPEQCRIAPPGIRAYDGESALSSLQLSMFNAVTIDRIEPAMRDDGLYITVHASSPWGRFDLDALDEPVLVGPQGSIALDPGVDVSNATHLAMDWLLPAEQAINGTYRIDITARNLAGTEVTRSELFHIGGDAPVEPATDPAPPVEKQSPAPALPMLSLALVALVAARRR